MSVIERLKAAASHPLSGSDIASLEDAIRGYRYLGYTDNEIVDILKWTEEVGPDVSEEYALQRMLDATIKAEERTGRSSRKQKDIP